MNKRGLTLIEILLVFSLVAVLATGSSIAFFGIRSNQAISASANNLKTVFERARIYSREGREEKAWGVSKISDSKYVLVSGRPGNFSTVSNFSLESPTQFDNTNWVVWFLPGSGNVDHETSVLLTNSRGGTITVLVTASGQVEIYK